MITFSSFDAPRTGDRVKYCLVFEAPKKKNAVKVII